jgi:HlyD family secretion protein
MRPRHRNARRPHRFRFKIVKKIRPLLPWIIAAAVAVGAWLMSRPSTSGPSTTLSLTAPRNANITFELIENGILEAESAIHIAAPDANADRRLIEIAPEGTLVSKGDVLAKFDTSRLEESLATLRESGLEARRTDAEIESKIRLADLEVAHQGTVENARLAELTFRSMTYNAKLERDAAETRLNNAKNEIQVAKNRVFQEENRRDIQLRQIDKLIAENNHKIDRTLADLESFTIHAPQEGIVVYPPTKISGITRKIQLGDQLFKGQVFLIIPNLYKMTAVLDVPEEEIRRIKPGLSVTIVPDAFPDICFTGEVATIAPLAHVRDNNPFIKAFRIAVRIHECDIDRLRPGMNARISIKLSSHTAAHIVPVPFLQSRDGRDFVWVEKDGKIDSETLRVLDADRKDAVVEARPGGRLVLPDAGLRAYLENPAASVQWKEWSPP